MTTEPSDAPDVASLLADLEWLLAVGGSVRVRRAGNKQIVQVSVEPDADTVIIARQVIGQTAPIDSLRSAMSSVRDNLDRREHRANLSLVAERTP